LNRRFTLDGCDLHLNRAEIRGPRSEQDTGPCD
jgi:hypothetical protein